MTDTATRQQILHNARCITELQSAIVGAHRMALEAHLTSPTEQATIKAGCDALQAMIDQLTRDNEALRATLA